MKIKDGFYLKEYTSGEVYIYEIKGKQAWHSLEFIQSSVVQARPEELFDNGGCDEMFILVTYLGKI